MPIRAALFDFDGTLADSFSAIAASTNHVRKHYQLPELPEATVREYVGHGLANLLENLVPNVPVAEAVAKYREHHPMIMGSLTRLFPGVPETLQRLRTLGIRTAVCSNKQVQFTKKLVGELNIAHLFDDILGPEDVGVPKPDPAMLHAAMKRLGTSPTDTVYIGDMVIDIQVARAAGVPVGIVTLSPAGRDDPLAANPDRTFRAFPEILDWLVPSTPG